MQHSPAMSMVASVNHITECPCFRILELLLLTREARHTMARAKFGERLDILLKERGWKQDYFAGVIKVDPSMVSLYVSGKSKPQADFMLDIADIFNVSLDWLMGRTDVREVAKPRSISSLNNEPGS